jgi:hypothetical protein
MARPACKQRSTPSKMSQYGLMLQIIKGYENCTWVTYKIVAYDNAGNNATKDNNGYGYKYHVIPEYPLTMMLTMLILTTSIATILLKKKGKAKPQLP